VSVMRKIQKKSTIGAVRERDLSVGRFSDLGIVFS